MMPFAFALILSNFSEKTGYTPLFTITRCKAWSVYQQFLPKKFILKN